MLSYVDEYTELDIEEKGGGPRRVSVTRLIILFGLTSQP